MHDDLLTVLVLLFAIVVVRSLSARSGLSFPILLVLVGLASSLIPGLPRVTLEPDLVFLVFLPPLLYEAAWFTSWREFRRYRGAIFLQSVGLVFCTSAIVAAVAVMALPGCTWALGFLLGGIVAPPDAVAATSVLHGLRIPRISTVVLEGESLVNDATSLIVVRFSLAAVAAGAFSMGEAATQLAWVSIVGVAIGLAVALAVFLLHRALRLTAEVDTALTLLTPYLMYVVAEGVHASGVLAVVAGGLFLSARAGRFLEARARVSAVSTWSTVVFVLNGVVFILIGLQLPAVVADLGGLSLVSAVGIGLVVSGAAIATRIAWTFPAAYLATVVPWAPKPRWQWDARHVTLISWAGMRGVVSLAAALALPATLADGTPFPLRSAIVLVTFIVILVTLVVQGLSLPWLVKRLHFAIPDDAQARRQALDTRLAAHAAAVCAPGEDGHRTGLAAQRVELHRMRDVGEVAHELVLEKELDLDMQLARLDARIERRRGH